MVRHAFLLFVLVFFNVYPRLTDGTNLYEYVRSSPLT